MNVSRINIFNVNRQGGSQFGGESPDGDVNSGNNKKKTDNATKFLYGACVVSAAILAAALAGRYGVFSRAAKPKAEPEVEKPVKKEITETIEEIFAKKEPVQQIPAKSRIREIPTEDDRAVRLKRNEVDLLKCRERVDYAKYSKCETPEQKKKFWQDIAARVLGLPYEYQYEDLPYYLKFIKNLNPDEINTSYISRGLKRDNFERYIMAILKFTEENPQFNNVFRANKIQFAENYRNYMKCGEKFDKEFRDVILPRVSDSLSGNYGSQAAFFTNSETIIARTRADKQVEEFRKYLDFVKFIGADRVKNHILFVPGKFAVDCDPKIAAEVIKLADDNNIKIAEEAIKFAKQNPEFQDTIVNNLIAYEPESSFARELCYNKFANIKKNEHDEEIKPYTIQYNRHVDNIIQIRKMLSGSGLKCDETARLKNRQDWMCIDTPAVNKYTLGFQYSPKIADIRYAAFEYDMKQGIKREEADSIIKWLNEMEATSFDFSIKNILGIDRDEAVAMVNRSVIS